MGEIKVFGLGGVLKFHNGVSYTPIGMDSSYFDFIPTFGLNWDCFEADFGTVFVPCYVALIRMILVAGFVVFLGTGLGHV